MQVNGKPISFKAVIGVLGGLATVISGWLFLDTHFARAADVNSKITQVYIDTQQSFVEMRLEQVNRALLDMHHRQQQGLTFPDDQLRKEELLQDRKRLLERQDKLRDQAVKLNGD